MSTDPAQNNEFRITIRSILLGLITVASVSHLAVRSSDGMVGGFVRSQFPMTVLMPFVLWLLVNTVLKLVWPRVSLRQGELLTILCMTWVVGTIPNQGWMNYAVPMLAAPTYYATNVNLWADSFFGYLPWHVFAKTSEDVIDIFWLGAGKEAQVPWEGWMLPAAHWLGASMTMVILGFCLFALFQRQWVEAERLTFPLAQMPLDLTRGFDGTRRLPDLFRSGLFWIGFGVVFLPLSYNIASYFSPGFQPLQFFIGYLQLGPGDPFPAIVIRLMPLVLAVVYLCPLDILGSLLFFYLLAYFKDALMVRTGFSVGTSGQEIGDVEILHLESYGALIFIAFWSIWLARNHLRSVWRLVSSGDGNPGEVSQYRTLVVGLLLSAGCLVGWVMGLGASLGTAVGLLLLMVLGYLAIVKMIAATGMAYLYMPIAHLKGHNVITDLLGSTRLSGHSMVAMKVFTSRIFFGNIRIPAWPSLPHFLRLFPHPRQLKWIAVAVLLAFPAGFLVAGWDTVSVAYEIGGQQVVPVSYVERFYDNIGRLVYTPTESDLGKWAVWLFGFGEAAVIALMRTRYHWFPLHPVGIAFQRERATWMYWFSLAMVFAVKWCLLKYGGQRAYRRGKLFFYGLGVGYVSGVMLSMAVDFIWFPGQRLHTVHNW